MRWRLCRALTISQEMPGWESNAGMTLPILASVELQAENNDYLEGHLLQCRFTTLESVLNCKKGESEKTFTDWIQ
jgi:hypothetical protein